MQPVWGCAIQHPLPSGMHTYNQLFCTSFISKKKEIYGRVKLQWHLLFYFLLNGASQHNQMLYVIFRNLITNANKHLTAVLLVRGLESQQMFMIPSSNLINTPFSLRCNHTLFSLKLFNNYAARCYNIYYKMKVLAVCSAVEYYRQK